MMRVTPEMIKAARRAEFDYYQRSRAIDPEKFIPTPDAVIKVMLEAALGGPEPVLNAPKPQSRQPTIVTAKAPRRR
jgi:hypothetical protein